MCERSIGKLDERLVALYREVGSILSKYRSGKLPKAFKVMPAMREWETLLRVCDPTQWTAAAMLQATRLFSSALHDSVAPAGRNAARDSRLAQGFYARYLLPRVRDEVAQYKKLNPHTFRALQLALYKPAAFFKGIVLPLCSVGFGFQFCF